MLSSVLIASTAGVVVGIKSSTQFDVTGHLHAVRAQRSVLAQCGKHTWYGPVFRIATFCDSLRHDDTHLAAQNKPHTRRTPHTDTTGADHTHTSQHICCLRRTLVHNGSEGMHSHTQARPSEPRAQPTTVHNRANSHAHAGFACTREGAGLCCSLNKSHAPLKCSKAMYQEENKVLELGALPQRRRRFFQI